MREQTSTTQQDLANWQWRNFGAQKASLLALGVAEECGELCHALLKREQSIRGMESDDAFLEAAGDAIADCAIYLTQIADVLKLDFVTLWATTARMVMQRRWKSED